MHITDTSTGDSFKNSYEDVDFQSIFVIALHGNGPKMHILQQIVTKISLTLNLLDAITRHYYYFILSLKTLWNK